jgi:hypothetical protein
MENRRVITNKKAEKKIEKIISDLFLYKKN